MQISDKGVVLRLVLMPLGMENGYFGPGTQTSGTSVSEIITANYLG